MSSHIHTGLIAGESPIGDWIHPLHTWFARRHNERRRQKHKKTLGPVFAARPSTYALPLGRARGLMAYHHRNPVEAGIVACPSESTWTSHRAIIGLDRPPKCLDIELAREIANIKDEATATSFHVWVRNTETVRPPRYMLAPLRAQPNATPLSPSDIADHVRHLLKGRDWSDRARLVSFARRVALVLAKRSGMTVAAIAPCIGLTASGASHLRNRAHNRNEVLLVANMLWSKMHNARRRECQFNVNVTTPSPMSV